MSAHDEQKRLLSDFRAKLAEQHKLRAGKSFEAWHADELRFMWTLVNAERLLRGRAYLPRAVVERAERSASGHVDYALKFALYCRDLVFEDDVAI